MTKFKPRLVALVSAAAIALGATTPAFALNEREQNALALILGAAAIGAIISDANKDKNRKRAADITRYQDHPWGQDMRGDRRWDRHDDDDRGFRRPRVTIPAQCTFPIRGGHGPRTVVSSRCMSQFGIARKLPRNCAFDVRIGHNRERVYGAQCLEQNGFRVAGRR